MRRLLVTIAALVGLMSAFVAGPAAAESSLDFILNNGGYNPDAASGGKGYTPIPREIVEFDTRERPGTIVIDSPARRLYLVLGDGKAMRYGVGVGRPGFEWGGVKTITRKAEWPSWTPPPQMLKRRPDLPRFMAGGPKNPLGARAMYLGSSLYRIHGSNEPQTIGQAVSSGCIRMTNDDVTDLYERVNVGTRVVIIRG
jgi:lipoprotein-anchoring transpeptidase ErfK/SrfK